MVLFWYFTGGVKGTEILLPHTGEGCCIAIAFMRDGENKVNAELAMDAVRSATDTVRDEEGDIQ